MKNVRLLCLLLILPAVGRAQLSWLRSNPGTSFGGEYVRPNYVGSKYTTMDASMFVLFGRIELWENAHLTIEVPGVRSSLEFSFSSQSTTRSLDLALGNITAGLEFGSTQSTLHLKATVPTLSRQNSLGGFVALYGDVPHVERYLADALVLSTGYTFHPALESGIRFLLGLAPSVWIDAGPGEKDDNGYLLDYVAGVGYAHQFFLAGVSVGGRTLVAKPWKNESAVHHLTAEAGFRLGSFQPGVSYRLPLDSDLTEIVQSTLGVQLVIVLE